MSDNLRLSSNQVDLIAHLDAIPMRRADYSFDAIMANLTEAVEIAGRSKVKTDLTELRSYISDAMSFLEQEQGNGGL